MKRSELVQTAARLLLGQRLAAHPLLDAALLNVEDDAQILLVDTQILGEQAQHPTRSDPGLAGTTCACLKCRIHSDMIRIKASEL